MKASPGRCYVTPWYTVLQDPSDFTKASRRVAQQGEQRAGARVPSASCLCTENVNHQPPWWFKHFSQDASPAKVWAKKRHWDTQLIEMSETSIWISLSLQKSLSKYIKSITVIFAMNKSCLNISRMFNYCHPQQPFLEKLYIPLSQKSTLKNYLCNIGKRATPWMKLSLHGNNRNNLLIVQFIILSGWCV